MTWHLSFDLCRTLLPHLASSCVKYCYLLLPAWLAKINGVNNVDMVNSKQLNSCFARIVDLSSAICHEHSWSDHSRSKVQRSCAFITVLVKIFGWQRTVCYGVPMSASSCTRKLSAGLLCACKCWLDRLISRQWPVMLNYMWMLWYGIGTSASSKNLITTIVRAYSWNRQSILSVQKVLRLDTQSFYHIMIIQNHAKKY